MNAVLNPVVGREFFGILRSPRSFATLFVLTVIFSIAVLMRWPTDATIDLSGTESLRVFRVFGYGLLAGIVFLVPAFPATSIVNERNSGTLALLLNSPMSALSIYVGKLAGVILFAVLVLLASLPGAAACYAMGGIDLWRGVGLFYLVMLSLVIQYAALGMLVSSYVHTADAAVRVTYTVVFTLLLFSMVPDAFFPGSGGWLGTIARYLRAMSPIPVLMEIMGQSGLTSRGLMESSSKLAFFVWTLGSSIVFAGITLSRMNYRIFDRSRSQGVITDDRRSSERLVRRLLFIVDPQRRKQGIPWYLNPVMVKEFRCRRFGRSQWLFRLVAVCAVASMVLTFAAATSVTSWGTDTIGGLLVILQVMLIIVLTPSLTAGLISGERDGSGWELLRLTPLSAASIVRGKIFSVLWTLMLVLLATLPGYIVMIYIQPKMLLQVQQVVICLAWTVVYTLAVSAAVGCLFRSTAIATTVAYVSVISLFLFPLLIWFGQDAPFGRTTVEKALMINPVGAALQAIGAPGFQNFELLPGAWIVAACVSALMFLLFGFQIWRLTRPV